MENKFPKNVRQIGNVSDTPKIYVEDYVDTFLNQICDKADKEQAGAFLVGKKEVTEGQECLYIFGAICMEFSGDENEIISQENFEKAEQEKEDALQFIQQTVEETKKKAEEEARKKAEEEAKKAEEQRLEKRQAVVDFALQFEGNPYVYGGTSLTNGADCSGFVMSVFANFGYSLPRVAAAQCDASTKKDISQLEPGDLVFYGSGYVDHVALYIGDGKIIHASGAATGIKISNYDYEQPAAVGTFME